MQHGEESALVAPLGRKIEIGSVTEDECVIELACGTLNGVRT
jgi:hypothetical protein